MLIRSGTTVRRTKGAAFGATRRRRGGAIFGSTSTTKSQLVAHFTPPQRPVGLHYLLFLLVGGLLCITIIGALAGVPLIRYGYRQMMKMPDRVAAWHEELGRFYSLWVCKKCGHEWVPEEA
jgi:hypothetical protein